ncbi:MAG: hypothetical protein BGO49_30510 [Planctomycetales bacterium 71-10]|nr:MAG: hypothetical protein BGO49_30510 [Planctomycetales bacterium 71-10]
MTRTTACPDGSDLLALATEGVAAPAVRSHVDACRSCLRKLRRLKAEVVHLRSSMGRHLGPAPATVVPRSAAGGD